MENTHNRHYPAEIFGYPINKQSEIITKIRNAYQCPFMRNEKCTKLSRLLEYPFGVCSTWWPGNNPLVICPRRLLQKNTIFANVANYIFGNTNNVLLFSEVKLKNIGTFDYVLVKHKPISSEIEDFCIVEFQSCSTTSTGKLVDAMKDFMNGENIMGKHYTYGMNTYNDIKLSFVQMLNKGQVLELWNKKIVWVIQKYLYDNMVNRFHLQNLELNKKDANLFFIFDIDYSNSDEYEIYLYSMSSSTIGNLMMAFRNSELPKIDDFIKMLHKKLKLNLGVEI